MFMKKLVEKASKKPDGNVDGLKFTDVDPGLVFHYGIPSGATILAYDSLQQILAISVQDGRIKLFGRENTQALLESPDAVSSKFMQFIQNKGILLNVTSKNQVEVWDIEKKVLSHVHLFKRDITSFTVIQTSLYMYVGDSVGDISILRFDPETCLIERMKYTIPFSAARGSPTEVSADTAVLEILPQPNAESKRVLLVFEDGLITLWEIKESRCIVTTGGILSQPQNHETRKVTSACWACPFGSKVAVGYNNGEIYIWSLPAAQNSGTEFAADSGYHNTPMSTINLGYKVEKIPIASLKWLHADGKASRLYILGGPDSASTNSLQVILLNDHGETRTIKLGIHLPEACIDMEIISSSREPSKHKQDSLVLIGKSGHIYLYDDSMIEKCLLQQHQSRGASSLPKEVIVKIPFSDSSITVAKFITNKPHLLCFGDEDYTTITKNIPSLFPLEAKAKDGSHMNQFTGFTKIKNLYITGHSDGAINFWDVTCSFLIPVVSLKQQSEDNFSLSGVAVTALHFDANSRLLISGDQNGMVRIFKLKPEPYAAENSLLSFQGSLKKGNSHFIQSVKLVQVNGSVLSINISPTSGHLAIGSDQGYVSVIDSEGPTLLYEKHIPSGIASGIISLQFETCILHGFEKNMLVIATKDSSVFALDADTGNMLGTGSVHPKKPSRALFLQILDGHNMLARGTNLSNVQDPIKGSSVEDISKKSFLLMCSEKAVYIYSLNHVAQGVKKVLYKKKFNSSSCCWASTFCGASDVGLVLLLSSGKIEIRSVPELSLIREFSVRGFTYSAPKLNSFSDSSITSSQDGEILMVNGDQQMFVVSVFLQKENYRLLDLTSQVFIRDIISSQEGIGAGYVIQKEKKKLQGRFTSMLKDIKGAKPKQGAEVETEDTVESIEELSMIFSTANFDSHDENGASMPMDDGGVDLDIDDIEIDDPGKKPKDQNIMAALNKKKLASKFQALTGKIKQQIKVKNEKNMKEEEQQDEKGGAVDEIKKKYGFSSSGESSAAKVAENKLRENLRKLQGINLKTTEMQDTAKSFSAMAKEVLRITEKDKPSS